MGLLGPWVPPPGREGVISRREAASNRPGSQQAQCPNPHRPALGLLWPCHRTPDGCGVGGSVRGVIWDTYPQAWSPRSRGQRPAPPVVSVVSWTQVSPSPFLSLCSPCLLPHEDCSPMTHVSDLFSTWAALQWPICTQIVILRSWGVQVPGPLKVTILVVDAHGDLWGGGGAPRLESRHLMEEAMS